MPVASGIVLGSMAYGVQQWTPPTKFAVSSHHFTFRPSQLGNRGAFNRTLKPKGNKVTRRKVAKQGSGKGSVLLPGFCLLFALDWVLSFDYHSSYA